MSKRCELQKEYYQQFGTCKGDGKYSDKYVSWLEDQVLHMHEHDVSVSLHPNESMREPIENALYATRRFLTTQATELADHILLYLKDAGYEVVRSSNPKLFIASVGSSAYFAILGGKCIVIHASTMEKALEWLEQAGHQWGNVEKIMPTNIY